MRRMEADWRAIRPTGRNQPDRIRGFPQRGEEHRCRDLRFSLAGPGNSQVRRQWLQGLWRSVDATWFERRLLCRHFGSWFHVRQFRSLRQAECSAGTSLSRMDRPACTGRSMARSGGSGQPGAPQINVHPEVRVEAPQVNVRVGERQLTDIVVDIVKSLRSRYRQGAGDGFVEAWE